MLPATLIVNNRVFTFSQLTDGIAEVELSSLSAYERSTLDCCRRWLTGQQQFVLPTSGSTGQPKAIVIDRAQLAASARLTGKALGLKAGDRALVCVSTEYVAGLMMLVRGFELGLALTINAPSRNPLALLPPESRFDFTAMAPLQLQEILNATPEKKAILDRMRAIIIGGAPVSEALQAQVGAIEAPLFHTYGMTETVSHIALRRLNGPQASDWFQPLEGVTLGLDRRGCLTVASVLTRRQTLVTNDRVELRPDGSFRWLGRLDNVINSGGVKVQAEQVETAVGRLFQDYRNGLLARRRFFVAPQEDPALGQAVTLVMEGTPLAPALQFDIRQKLRQQGLLTKYEIPRYFQFKAKFVETPTGKIDRRANWGG